ncbi:hypothetical protein VTI74DRAFT_5122 [Chaetomium olivicolor]
MPSYAVLGATGNTGRALLQVLLQSPVNQVNAYCRSKDKLHRVCPEAAKNDRVRIFEGRLDDVSLLADCIRGTRAVFLAVAVVDNMPGCTVARDTASVVVAALEQIRARDGPGTQLPKLIQLSSASLEKSFCGDVPAPVHWVLSTAVSHLYKDLAEAETFLRAQESWLTSVFVKPGALVHDRQSGHEVSTTKAKTPLSFLDLAAGMLEVADDDKGLYDMRNVSVLSTSEATMESIFHQIKDLYAKADEKGRREIQGYIRELQVGFYSDWDVVMRLTSGPMQVALAKIAIDLDIFQTLMESETPVTLKQLVEKTGAAPHLLGRILRTMAAFGLVKETGKYEYTASAFTRVLSDPNAAGTISHLVDVPGACTQAMPDFLAETNYQDIVSDKHTVFQKALKTDLTFFEWARQNPKHLSSLGHLMALQRPTFWVDNYPAEQKLGPLTPSPNTPILVDVGGGFGQQAIAFLDKFPHLAGSIVVQDIPETLAGARPIPGIKFVEHDFFGPQTITGARLYYLRHILHDWPDAACVKILQNIIPAMGPDSRIIIDELVMPEMGVPWQSAYLDLLMMNTLGGVERTKPEWEALLHQAGLKILEIYQYDSKMQCVIVTVPK